MKFEKKQVYYVVLAFGLCYALQAYWNNAAGIIGTIYNTCFPFLIGAGIAYIINIVMSAYEKLYMRFVTGPKLLAFKRPLSLLLAYFTFIVIIVWIFSIVLPDLISSLNSLLSIDTTKISDFIHSMSKNELINKLFFFFVSNSDLSSTFSGYGQQLLKQVLSVLTGVLTSMTGIVSTVLGIFISFVFSIYVLASKERLGRQFSLLIDTYTGKYAKTIHYVVGILNKRFHGFFVSQTLEAMILGSLTAGGMFLFKLPYAATIGVLVAFTAIIPVVGPYIGLTIGFFLIATQNISQAFFFVIYLIVLQQFEGNIIYPRVVGGTIGLPGMWVLMTITVGWALGGILGMIIAVPFVASLYQILKDNVAKHHQDLTENP